MKKSVLGFLIILLISSCSNESDTDPNTTNDTDLTVVNSKINPEVFNSFIGNWELVAITVSDGTQIVSPVTVTIIFSNDESEGNFLLNGKSTCNLYGGAFTSLANGSVTFQELYSTEQLCEDSALNDFEIEYWEWLYNTNSYRIENDSLRLIGAVEILFKRIS